MKHHSISMRRRHLVIAGLAGVATPAALFAGQCGAAASYAPAELVTRGAAEGTLVVSGRLLGAPDGKPLAGAVVEAWHANAPADLISVSADADGRFVFMTVAPLTDSGRPPHIRYRVSHQGQVLATRELYFAPERGAAPQQIAQLERDDTGVWRAAFGLVLA